MNGLHNVNKTAYIPENIKTSFIYVLFCKIVDKCVILGN